MDQQACLSLEKKNEVKLLGQGKKVYVCMANKK
jgi:hypothetical protein